MSDTTTSVTERDLGARNQELALNVLGTIGSEKNFDLMADDVVLEFPYGLSLGMPDRFVGKEAAVAYLRQMFSQVAGLKMRDIVTHSVAGHPEIVFAEYRGDAPTAGGNSYEQVYQNKLQFRDGLLVSMREFCDPKRIIDALDGNVHA